MTMWKKRSCIYADYFKGIKFCGIKFCSWAHPQNLDILRGFNFADKPSSKMLEDANFHFFNTFEQFLEQHSNKKGNSRKSCKQITTMKLSFVGKNENEILRMALLWILKAIKFCGTLRICPKSAKSAKFNPHKILSP